MVEEGRKVVDVRCADVAESLAVEEAAAAAGLAGELDEQTLYGAGIELLRRRLHQFADGRTDGVLRTVRPVRGHGIEGVGDGDDAGREAEVAHMELVRIA